MKMITAASLIASLFSLVAAAEPAVVQNGQFQPAAFVERLQDQKLPDGCTITQLALHEAEGQNAEYASIGLHQIAREVRLDINAPVPVKVYADGTFRAEWNEVLGSAQTSLTVLFNKDLSIRTLNFSRTDGTNAPAEQVNCKPLFN